MKSVSVSNYARGIDQGGYDGGFNIDHRIRFSSFSFASLFDPFPIRFKLLEAAVMIICSK